MPWPSCSERCALDTYSCSHAVIAVLRTIAMSSTDFIPLVGMLHCGQAYVQLRSLPSMVVPWPSLLVQETSASTGHGMSKMHINDDASSSHIPLGSSNTNMSSSAAVASAAALSSPVPASINARFADLIMEIVGPEVDALAQKIKSVTQSMGVHEQKALEVASAVLYQVCTLPALLCLILHE